MTQPPAEILNLDDYLLIITVGKDGRVLLRSDQNTMDILRNIERIRAQLITLITPPPPREKD